MNNIHKATLFPHFLIVLIPLLLSGCATSQQLEALTTQNHQDSQALLAELKNINQQLEKLQKTALIKKTSTPSVVEVSIKDRAILGNKKAPITIVEFTDYQCPYCSRFNNNTLPALKREFIDTGKVKLLVKDLPLGFHKYARKAAQASRCADDQSQYWDMHDLLFKNRKALALDSINQYAKTLKMNFSKFDQCMKSGRHLKAIDSDIAEGQKLGIRGTPSFVIGLSNYTKKDIVKGRVLRGAKPIASFRKQIDQLLKK